MQKYDKFIGTALVAGGTGFIGHHLAKRLKDDGYYVRVVDIQPFRHGVKQEDVCHDFKQLDLRNYSECMTALTLDSVYLKWDMVFQLAADMGGAGFIFTKENDLEVMHNSAQVNLNFAYYNNKYKKIFYSSSACVYPEYAQMEEENCGLKESMALPASPDSCYGWEKLFSEFLYDAVYRNAGVEVRVARFHNIYGPEGTWDGGREKAPAAFCRKVITSDKEFPMWGDGKQTRSFTYIDDCVDGVLKLMENDFRGPINIGSTEMISMNDFAKMIMEIENKDLKINHLVTGDEPVGVRGRNSENTLILEKLDWEPSTSLKDGIKITYNWIKSQVEKGETGDE